MVDYHAMGRLWNNNAVLLIVLLSIVLGIVGNLGYLVLWIVEVAYK